jgi:hypothetical protein
MVTPNAFGRIIMLPEPAFKVPVPVKVRVPPEFILMFEFELDTVTPVATVTPPEDVLPSVTPVLPVTLLLTVMVPATACKASVLAELSVDAVVIPRPLESEKLLKVEPSDLSVNAVEPLLIRALPVVLIVKDGVEVSIGDDGSVPMSPATAVKVRDVVPVTMPVD